MKKEYEIPEIEVLNFVADIITTSMSDGGLDGVEEGVNFGDLWG